MSAFLSKIWMTLFPPKPKRAPIDVGRATMTIEYRNHVGGIDTYTRTVQGSYLGGAFEMFVTAEQRVDRLLRNAAGNLIEDDAGVYLNMRYVDRVTVRYEELLVQPE